MFTRHCLLCVIYCTVYAAAILIPQCRLSVSRRLGPINNNNCLKSNIQCIEIRVQWTVHFGSSHMHVNAVTRVHAVTPKLVICEFCIIVFHSLYFSEFHIFIPDSPPPTHFHLLLCTRQCKPLSVY